MLEKEPDKELSKINFRALVLLFFLLFITILILFFSLNWRNNQKIKKIQVIGNQAITKNELIIFAIDTAGGKNRGDFNLSDLKLKIESHPFIYKADVLQNNSDELLINIIERKPFAAIANQDGSLDYIDKEVKHLPYSIFSRYSDVPIIRNALQFNTIDSSKILIALNFLKKVDSINYGSFYKNVSEIVFFNNEKRFYLISADAGVKILMPDEIYKNEIINNIDLVWRKLSTAINLKEVSYVDLRWQNRIITGYSTKDSTN